MSFYFQAPDLRVSEAILPKVLEETLGNLFAEISQ